MYCSNHQSLETPVQPVASSSGVQEAATETNQEEEYSTSSSEQPVKRSVDQADVELREVHQPSKRRAGPYGAWNTVAVYERTEVETPKETSEGGGQEKEEEEEEEGSSEDERSGDKLRFKEKTVSSLGSGEGEPSTVVGGGGFKGFGFKKRTGNRPQIRQLRTNDL